MKKKNPTLARRKSPPQMFRATPQQQAESFRRPLGWLNRVLDALIDITRGHIAAGDHFSVQEILMIDLLKEYKIRAIREGFADYYPEINHRFIVWYELWEKLNRDLARAKSVANDQRRCKINLGMAKETKLKMVELFPNLLGVRFSLWYFELSEVDNLLERLDEAVRHRRINRFRLQDLLRELAGALRLLNEVVGDALAAGAGSPAEGMRVAIEMALARIQVLIEVVQQGDVEPGNPADIRRIREILRRVRRGKYHAIVELGIHAGTSMDEWYKGLFEIDYYIDNAADSWVDGKVVPWNPEATRRTIEAAERAKDRFIHSFPDFLGKPLIWYYNNLYKMDVSLDYAKFLMFLDDDQEVLDELRKVRRHKHNLERHLRQQF